ncbi:hypothetical protein PRECH8_22150 [Insulibacter thermoxylanivorax]|uniref:Uncharacterized protein n=1 Tax=Insulibacter thermoxylanivorax TaxID=2749268 RepID=A0A916QHE9_9BACL|nr:hypothetical protein [Insulibacter thermoxylanivorax]GFR38919.1 hypothetical protein PRECH8_22150 [Insulibacter thermoxylanivorax]
MRCPNCNSKDIGKIGSHQYYCWGCFIELTINGDKMSVYQVEEDGTLSSLDDLFFEDEMPPLEEELQSLEATQMHAN